MTPPPPPVEGSSLPPRHRPSVETLVKNSTELDLWNLDDLPSDKPEAESTIGAPSANPIDGTAAPLATAIGPAHIPQQKNIEVPVLPRQTISQNANVERLGRIRKPRYSQAPETLDAPPSTVDNPHTLENTFQNLADWEVPEQVPDPPPPPPTYATVVTATEEEPPPATPSAATAPAVPEQDEFVVPINPDAKPISLRPRLHLTKLDVAGLLTLAVILLAGGTWVYQHSLSRLHSQSSQSRTINFPVQGKYVTVTKVTTYWREPLNTKGHTESVRRGVVLIPVTELTLRGGPGAIRSRIYNDENRIIGDPITYLINGEITLVIPATDGFSDLSMHAAYRAGQSKPWTLRVFEAASENTPGEDFKQLLECPIATEKR